MLETICRKSISHISHLITVDKFISAQNGTLIKIFHDLNFPETKIKKDDIKKSIFLQHFIKNNLITENYVNIIMSAYYRFKEYLKDKNMIVNYIFLWDFITK